MCLVEGSSAELLNSSEYAMSNGHEYAVSEYAVGGYCEQTPAFFSDTETLPHVVAEGNICDMCGQLLPPTGDDRLRKKHIQVPHVKHFRHCCKILHRCYSCYFQKMFNYYCILYLSSTMCSYRDVYWHCHFA